MLHDKENWEDGNQFLKQNGQKFQGDCLLAMRLMYSGVKLTSQDCWEKYKIHDRRLRNCRSARPDIVKSEWVLKANGSRSHVVYWIDLPRRPTKAEVIEKSHKATENLGVVEKTLVTVFSLPEDVSPKNYIQPNLFD